MAYPEYASIVTHKCQLAAQALLVAAITANGSSVEASDIFAGIGRGDLPLPRVVCECKRAVVEESWDGNWNADLTIRVIASAEDTTEDEFHLLCGEIFAQFLQGKEDVAVSLSSAAIKFTAQFVIPRSQEWDLVGGSDNAEWTSELKLEVKCCGSVVG